MEKTFKILLRAMYLPLVFIGLSASCSLPLIEDVEPDNGSSYKKTVEALNGILAEFGETEENKDGEGHRALYLSNESKLNFIFPNYGSPYFFGMSRDEWIGYFKSWDYEYFPVYSDNNFYIKKGMAIDSHKFQGYRDGKPDISGTDLFMYVETSEGWKLLSISATIVNPDDETDYSSIEFMTTTPEEALKAFTHGINTGDLSSFENVFSSISSPCFRFKNKLKEGYSDSLHSAKAFYDAIQESTVNLNIRLQDVEVEVYDQLIAVASSKYAIERDGRVVENGEMLATLVGTPQESWKISAMTFSIKKQIGNR